MITKQNVSETLRDYANVFSEDSKVLRANMLAVADWLDENIDNSYPIYYLYISWFLGGILGCMITYLFMR